MVPSCTLVDAMSNRFQLALGGALIGLFTIIRLPLLSTHFTHVDDIGVASTILKAKTQPSVYEGLKGRIYDTAHPEYLSNKYRVFRFADKIGILSRLETVKVLFIVSLTWTYAPLQFLLTGFLIHANTSYEQNLILGRSPSLLAFLAGCFLLILLTRKIYNNDWWLPAIFGLILLGLSWQNIIYSVHMASYAIGVPALIAALLIYLQTTEDSPSGIFKLGQYGIFLAMTFAAQYQMLLFLPAIFGGIFLFRRSKILPIGIFFAALALPTYYLFFHDFSGRSLNWNIGPAGEYLYNIRSQFGLADKLLYSFHFFASNFWEVFQSDVSMVPEDSIFFTPINTVLFALFLLGLASFFRSGNGAKQRLRPVIVFILATWLLLIISGKVALSPTRHTLILLPMIVLSIIEGIQVMGRYLGLRFSFIFSMAFAAICLTGFFRNYAGIVQIRRNKIVPHELRDHIQKHEASLLYSYDWTYDPLLMRKTLPDNLPIFVREFSTIPAPLPTNERRPLAIAFLSHRRPLNEQIFEELLPDLRKMYPEKILALNWKNSSKVFESNAPGAVEVDFLPRTLNGKNGLFLTIIVFPGFK